MTVAPSTTTFLLPPSAYTSEEWFAWEQRAIFERTWWFAGPEADVPADGGAVLVPIGRITVAVARDDDGRLVAQRDDGGDAWCDTWLGFIFVFARPEADSPSLRDFLGDLPNLIGPFQPQNLVEVARQQFRVECNWKLYVENHIDVYHLWYLHERSLAAYDHPKHRWDDCAPHWSFYEPPRPGVEADAQFVRGFVPISNVTPDWWGSGAHLIWPCVPFATGAAFFMTYQLIPHGPELLTIDLRVRAEPLPNGQTHDATAFLDMAQTVLHREDGLACERIQRALRSPAFKVGPLAAGLEEPITRFHEHLLEAINR